MGSPGSRLPPGEVADGDWYIHGVVELVVLGLGRGRHGGQASKDSYSASVVWPGAGVVYSGAGRTRSRTFGSDDTRGCFGQEAGL